MQQIDVTTTLKVVYDASEFIPCRNTGNVACQIAVDLVENALQHEIDNGALAANMGDAEVEHYEFETHTRYDHDSKTVHLSTELKVSYDCVNARSRHIEDVFEAMFNRIYGSGGLTGSSTLMVDKWELVLGWILSGRPASSTEATSSLVDVADYQLNAAQLREKYETLDPGDHWAEHPDFTHADWAQEAAELNTLNGYWDWVVNEIEQRQDEIENGLCDANDVDVFTHKTQASPSM